MKSSSEKYNVALLDYLTAATKSHYLSNLFYETPFKTSSGVISSIPDNAYSLLQWEEATQYLLREKILFTSTKEAIHYLAELGRAVEEPPNEFLKLNKSLGKQDAHPS
ncbi:hypothetical protein [Anaerotignum sp.]|uniref:hypothetical protein n=1 Tax=Anaerotignum sp. TaxID=2039241 RepID=UPI0028B21E54|nr:hypothetical protein [Anaerotignum sp.]